MSWNHPYKARLETSYPNRNHENLSIHPRSMVKPYAQCVRKTPRERKLFKKTVIPNWKSFANYARMSSTWSGLNVSLILRSSLTLVSPNPIALIWSYFNMLTKRSSRCQIPWNTTKLIFPVPKPKLKHSTIISRLFLMTMRTYPMAYRLLGSPRTP